MKIVSIVGARPNFVKIAPISWELSRLGGHEHVIVHTGQHLKRSMSESFFRLLEIPDPDVTLKVDTDGPSQQIGAIMSQLEPVLERLNPDWVLVVGDVDSTVAAALIASRLGLKTAHIEAGLRSFDRTMPEEINRVIVDVLCDLYFVTEKAGMDNLQREGVAGEKVQLVGNVMIDSLIRMLPKAKERQAWRQFGVEPAQYLVVTLHRPGNVDNLESLADLVQALIETSKGMPIIFPAHPRTMQKLREFDLLDELDKIERLILAEPMDYVAFLSLVSSSAGVITDSGGIQEETTYLGIPCLTLRPNTERPVTVEIGTNELVSPTGDALRNAVRRLLSGSWKKGTIPPFWDGQAAKRILDVLLSG